MRTVSLVAIAALGFNACSGEESADTNSSIDEDAFLAPPFSLDDLSGRKISLSDYAGKVILLNFWAAWCAPCREEMPFFTKLRDKYKNDGFEVLAVSIDAEPQKDIPPFVAELGLDLPILLATPTVIQQYGIVALPTTFIINRKGRIVAAIVGSQPLSTFEAVVKNHL